jgi:hypothetical protein
VTISVSLAFWGPRVRAQVKAFDQRWPTLSWGTYLGHDPSRALATDGMVPGWGTKKGNDLGWEVARWLWANRKKNGLWYVIFDGKIISTTRPEKGWLPYFNRNSSDPSKSHKNHDHCSWHEDGDAPAVKPDVAPYTEGWVPDLPWVFYLDRQEIGVTQSDSVWLLQKALGMKPYDGNYTQALRDRVKTYQAVDLGDDPQFCDGILGPGQAKALFSDAIDIENHS